MALQRCQCHVSGNETLTLTKGQGKTYSYHDEITIVNDVIIIYKVPIMISLH